MPVPIVPAPVVPPVAPVPPVPYAPPVSPPVVPVPVVPVDSTGFGEAVSERDVSRQPIVAAATTIENNIERLKAMCSSWSSPSSKTRARVIKCITSLVDGANRSHPSRNLCDAHRRQHTASSAREIKIGSSASSTNERDAREPSDAGGVRIHLEHHIDERGVDARGITRETKGSFRSSR
ncbi:MAG TPA: hypothetical protein VFQ53_42615 [Kofleriaceae bacterium]|nr:hypothetical protein [Kofleriaceae bacterium]